MSIAVPLIILVVLVCGAGIAYLLHKKEKARQEAWRVWANSRGWSYSPDKDSGTADWFSFVNRLRKGSHRYAKDVMKGVWNERPIVAFSYHYETYSTNSEGRRQTNHHWLSVVAVQFTDSGSFPELTIAPENFLRRFGNVFTGSDIDFESIEFSKAYEVKSDSKKFAYDFCHTGMIEYLLKSPGTSFELEGQWIADIHTSKLHLPSVEPRLQHLSNISNLMPAFMFRS